MIIFEEAFTRLYFAGFAVDAGAKKTRGHALARIFWRWSGGRPLRAAGVSTQIYTEKKKFKAKMNYADKLKVPYVYFLGEDEINAGVVSCKDMRTGEQVKLPRAEAVEKAKAFVESDRQKPVICEK